jgi:hypothetical protein
MALPFVAGLPSGPVGAGRAFDFLALQIAFFTGVSRAQSPQVQHVRANRRYFSYL